MSKQSWATEMLQLVDFKLVTPTGGIFDLKLSDDFAFNIEALNSYQDDDQFKIDHYDQKREWLINFLVPQAKQYANSFPTNSDWKVIPVFDRVPGLFSGVTNE